MNNLKNFLSKKRIKVYSSESNILEAILYYSFSMIAAMCIIYSMIFILGTEDVKFEMIKIDVNEHIGKSYSYLPDLNRGSYIVDDIQSDKLIIDDKEYIVGSDYTYLESMDSYTGKLFVENSSQEGYKDLIFEFNYVTNKDLKSYMLHIYGNTNFTYEEMLSDYGRHMVTKVLLLAALIIGTNIVTVLVCRYKYKQKKTN